MKVSTFFQIYCYTFLFLAEVAPAVLQTVEMCLIFCLFYCKSASAAGAAETGPQAEDSFTSLKWPCVDPLESIILKP